MRYNNDIMANTVAAENQVSEKFKIFMEDERAIRVLFLGNSITLHEKAPQIGWNHNWGMAATAEEKDYVHIVLSYLREKYGKINFCICNCGSWEKNFADEQALYAFENAKNFKADIVIARLGENVNLQAFDEKLFFERYRAFLNYFNQNAKQTVVTNLFWAYEGIERAIGNICKADNFTYVDISDLGYDDTNKALGCYEHQGVCLHPNDKGMKNIADRIIAKL